MPTKKSPGRSARTPGKGQPARRELHSAPEPVTLEEVMIGFQKSLARVNRYSAEQVRADAGLALGERALYTIDGLTVRLAARVLPAVEGGQVTSLLLDLASRDDPQGLSALEFKVEARPIEPLGSSQIMLADLDPLGLERPVFRIRGTLMLAPAAPAESPPAAGQRAFRPMPRHGVTVHVHGGDTNKSYKVEVQTNVNGQFELMFDAATSKLTAGGKTRRLPELINLAERDDDFFVFATAKGGLISNVLHFEVSRKRDLPEG